MLQYNKTQYIINDDTTILFYYSNIILLGKGGIFMYDRFLIKKNNDFHYCFEMAILVRKDIEIVRQERTFDNGNTWVIM